MQVFIVYDNLLTNYPLLGPASEEINNAFISRSVKPHYLALSHETKKSILDLLIENQDEPGIFVYYGHGCSCGCSLIFGENNSLISLSNLKLLHQKKILYVVACHTSKNLGQAFVNNGSKSFFGYNHTFQLAGTDEKHLVFQSTLLRTASSGLFEMIISNITSSEAVGIIRKNYRILLHKIKSGQLDEKNKIKSSMQLWYGFIAVWNLEHFEPYITNELKIF